MDFSGMLSPYVSSRAQQMENKPLKSPADLHPSFTNAESMAMNSLFFSAHMLITHIVQLGHEVRHLLQAERFADYDTNIHLVP